MKPDFTGTELYVSTMDHISPNYLRKDKMSLVSGNGLFDYMKNRWNFYIDTDYTWQNTEELNSSETHYLLENIVEKTLSTNNDQPTGHGYQRNYRLSLNADYKLHPNHIIGAVYTLGLTNDDSYSISEYEQENLTTDTRNLFSSSSISDLKNTSHFAGLFYEGRGLKGWSLGAKAQFYIDNSHSDNFYHRSSGFEERYITYPSLNYTFASINLYKKFFNKLHLNANYNYINRNRKIDDDSHTLLTRMNEDRQYASVGVDFEAGRKTYLSGSISFLNDHVLSAGIKTVTNNFGGRLRLRHTVNNKLSFLLSYYVDSDAPTSSQLTDYGQFISPYIYQGGNPDLKTGVSHSVWTDIKFLGMFTLSGSYNYMKNMPAVMSEKWYGTLPDGSSGKFILQRPVNCDFSGWALSLSLFKNIGPVRVNARIEGKQQKAHYKAYEISKTHLVGNADVRYTHFPSRMTFRLTYIKPLVYGVGSPQFWRRYTNDDLTFSVDKMLLRGSMIISAMYQLPLHFSSNEMFSFNDSPAMRSTSVSRSFRLHDNQVTLYLTYMFSSGNRIERFTKEIHKEK